jgi:cytochrome c553
MCKECTFDGYNGCEHSVPRLSGQSPTYLELTLLAFKTGARANNPAMSALVGLVFG